jgi:hypothetical protein
MGTIQKDFQTGEIMKQIRTAEGKIGAIHAMKVVGGDAETVQEFINAISNSCLVHRKSGDGRQVIMVSRDRFRMGVA